MRPFVAIDGESYTIDDVHKYVLLMDSDRRFIYDPEGISTKRCFDFLLALPKKCIPVAFGLNYDANMMFRDFGRARLTELWNTGFTCWHNYEVEWIPGKWLRIATGVRKTKSYKTVKINETFGFFQSSFVKALEAWKIEFQDAEELEAMKAERSLFDQDMTDRVIDYCHTECVQLVRLMDRLRDALLGVDLDLKSWNGAGSVAAIILRNNGVKHALTPHTELPMAIQSASLHSYFGGRTELFQQGEIDTVTEYDIASAYPYAATFLPSLFQGAWEHRSSFDALATTGMWRVSWDVGNNRVCPFPYRYKGSRICYPANGSGWYHTIEVAAALEAYPQEIDVHEGWVLVVPEDGQNSRPFAFIQELFDYRRKLKADGHAGEKCIKLGINSVYGKLAQGVGYRDSLPPFQSYVWAGQITAQTRARMFTLAKEFEDDVIMLATDAIFLRGCRTLDTGKSLGDLERVDIGNAFFAQPGVYRALLVDTAPAWHPPLSTEIKRSRGFFAREIDFPQLAQGYDEHGPDFVGRYESTRFVGAGTSLLAKDLGAWRTWETKERKLSLYPSTKNVENPDSRPIRHMPPRLEDPSILSAAYALKSGGYLDDEKEYAQGREQPLRT